MIDSAGGIGGLLATEDVAETQDYYYVYDANGNVCQVLDASDGSIEARYEYDAYGNNLLDPTDPNESGPYAADNPFRFSTKYWDDETGLGYWGYRYYTPRLGRWTSRDPIEEQGHYALFNYATNDPIGTVDAHGLCGMSNQECCDAVKAKGDDWGDKGGVVCCDGRKVSCVWIKSQSGHKFADKSIDQCVKRHENVHHDDVVDCPPCGAIRSPWKKGVKRNHEECTSHLIEYNCLTGKKHDVKCNAKCKQVIEEERRIVYGLIRHYCPPSRWP